MSAKLAKLFLSDISLRVSHIHAVLYILFFFSGCAALIYQVMWQRMLFTIFGVDLMSITIIVSVFMFGLGIGGLFGGYIADLVPKRLLSAYIIIELGIAVFGFCSPDLIDKMGTLLFSEHESVTVVASFLLLAFPTILMGATFPILVAHVHAFNHNIGQSVGNLYFANTLGGAMGAYVSGFVLLFSLDIAQAIDRAALINLFIASVAFMMFRRGK